MTTSTPRHTASPSSSTGSTGSADSTPAPANPDGTSAGEHLAVPAPQGRRDHNLWPLVVAADALALRQWLASLGFDDGILVTADGDPTRVHHSEMLWPEGGRVMVASADTGDSHVTARVGGGTCYVVCDDPAAVLARAETVGADVVRPLESTDYGSTGLTVADPEGNRWSFGTYAG